METWRNVFRADRKSTTDCRQNQNSENKREFYKAMAVSKTQKYIWQFQFNERFCNGQNNGKLVGETHGKDHPDLRRVEF